MRLNEFYNKPLNEIVKEMELADIKIHTDDDNNIRTIEVKYAVSTKEEKKTNSVVTPQPQHPWQF